MTNERQENEYVISYSTLRRAVGILGMALPVVLFFGFILNNKYCVLPPSISHYYYTYLGSYFTGTLCAVSLFLFSYRGPQSADRRTALIASACALGVVFFPTNPCSDCCNTCILVELNGNHFRNFLHFSFATVLFSCFAYFSYFLFTRTNAVKAPSPEKLKRNQIYRFCAWIIIICIVLIPVFALTPVQRLPWVREFRLWTFLFEAIALFAFGFSWLVKGNTILRDK
jgi:hypothetical protein